MMNEEEVKQKDKLAVGIQKAAQHIAEFTQSTHDSRIEEMEPQELPEEVEPSDAERPAPGEPADDAPAPDHTPQRAPAWEMRERFRFLMDESPLGVYSVNVQGRIKDINSNMVKLLGCASAEDVLDLRVMDYPPLHQAGIAQEIQKCLESRKNGIFERHITNEQGRQVFLRIFLAPIYALDGSIAGAWITAEDISGQKQADGDIRRTHDFGSVLQRTALRFAGEYAFEDAVKAALEDLSGLCGAGSGFVIMLEGGEKKMYDAFEWCAPDVESRLENVNGISFNRYQAWAEQLQNDLSIHVRNIEELEGLDPEKSFLIDRKKNGFLAVPLKIKNKFAGFVGFDDPKNAEAWQVQDIEYIRYGAAVLGRAFERRMAEEERRNEIVRHRELAEAGYEGIVLISQGKVKQANPALADLLGIDMSVMPEKSLIDFFPQPERKKVSAFLSGDSTEPVKTFLARQDGSSVAVELRGKPVRSTAEVLFGISVRVLTDGDEAEIGLKEKYEHLLEAMEGTIQALGSAAEIRDPYMAGHERRVAQLASAVAAEMGLPPDRIEGLRIAALVHDLGKISIPAEILGKPGKVTESEYNLIRNHPQTGYEILKKIKLPWPVADIVRQHHERMDGSGYPQGLAGDSILLEARIMAVADSIEAISAHRPHRPAEGIEEALREISRSKGSQYDTDVVDACLRVFQKKKFTFS